MMMNCHQSRTIQPGDDANNVEEGQGFEQELGDHDGDQDCDNDDYGNDGNDQNCDDGDYQDCVNGGDQDFDNGDD